MISVPSGVRVWLAVGRIDMLRGMNGLASQVQQALGRDRHLGVAKLRASSSANW
jgi:transposase